MTLFKSIIVLCGNDIIPQNIPHIHTKDHQEMPLYDTHILGLLGTTSMYTTNTNNTLMTLQHYNIIM